MMYRKSLSKAVPSVSTCNVTAQTSRGHDDYFAEGARLNRLYENKVV